MPPKAKITKDMIVDAAFEIAREKGAEHINARNVSHKLGCSTQPIMYHFATIEDMKRSAYEKADRFHTDCLMSISEDTEDVMLEIGLNYIRFAVVEPNLFKFLFQSGYGRQNSILEMIEAQELAPVLMVMQGAMGINEKQTKEVFLTLALFAHGYASIIANNSLEYDEKIVAYHLERVYSGAISGVKENE